MALFQSPCLLFHKSFFFFFFIKYLKDPLFLLLPIFASWHHLFGNTLTFLDYFISKVNISSSSLAAPHLLSYISAVAANALINL